MSDTSATEAVWPLHRSVPGRRRRTSTEPLGHAYMQGAWAPSAACVVWGFRQHVHNSGNQLLAPDATRQYGAGRRSTHLSARADTCTCITTTALSPSHVIFNTQCEHTIRYEPRIP